MGELVFSDSGVGLGTFGNVLVTVARGAPTGAGMRMARTMHQKLVAAYPRGYAHLIVTQATARMPTAEERKDMQETTKAFSRYMVAQALVLEGEGLIAASWRMVTQSMLLALPRSHPSRAFADVMTAVEWIRLRSGPEQALDMPGLCNFVDRLRVQQAA